MGLTRLPCLLSLGKTQYLIHSSATLCEARSQCSCVGLVIPEPPSHLLLHPPPTARIIHLNQSSFLLLTIPLLLTGGIWQLLILHNGRSKAVLVLSRVFATMREQPVWKGEERSCVCARKVDILDPIVSPAVCSPFAPRHGGNKTVGF